MNERDVKDEIAIRDRDAQSRETWLVVASICSCCKVAITVLENVPGVDDGPATHEDEMVATGPDWEPLVERLAVALADRTGCIISGTCSVVSAKDKQVERDIDDALSTLLYKLRDARKATT